MKDIQNHRLSVFLLKYLLEGRLQTYYFVAQRRTSLLSKLCRPRAVASAHFPCKQLEFFVGQGHVHLLNDLGLAKPAPFTAVSRLTSGNIHLCIFLLLHAPNDGESREGECITPRELFLFLRRLGLDRQRSDVLLESFSGQASCRRGTDSSSSSSSTVRLSGYYLPAPSKSGLALQVCTWRESTMFGETAGQPAARSPQP